MKLAPRILIVLSALVLTAACSEAPDKETRYAADETGIDLFAKPAKDSEKIAHAAFSDIVMTGRTEKSWVHAAIGEKRGWVLDASVSKNDPMINVIREKAAPLLHRSPQDVGVRRLQGSVYEVTNFALVSGDMSATVYDLWLRTGNTASKTAHLGPGRSLVQAYLNNDDLYDYLLEGGMPGTGREYVVAFLGGANGRAEKVAEVTGSSEDAPHITSTGPCEKTTVETLSVKPRHYKFDCASNRFVEQK